MHCRSLTLPACCRRWFAVLVILCLATLCWAAPIAAAADRPNIVLFLVDDMGWMDCGVYGSRYYETPHIDRLATRGMRFTDAYSANPLCSPTRASILTGKYPARLGLTTAAGHQPPLPPEAPRYAASAPANRAVITPESLRYLDPDEYTLAEALRDAGYATGHFGKWHLGLTEPHWPERQGYQVAWHGKPDPGPPSPHGYFSPYSFKAGTITPGPDGEYIVDRLTDESIRFIEGSRDRPFFAAVWQYGVHGPWDFKEAYAQAFTHKTDPRGQQSNPVMAAMLRSVDESLGRILETLDRLGLADNTIVLFASDNGGNVHSNIEEDRRSVNVRPGHPQYRSLSQYRKYAKFLPPTNNHPLRAGKGTLYEGGVRVPLIVSWPGRITRGATTGELASTIDFYPTLLELAGIEQRPDTLFDGISLAPVLTGAAADTGRDAVFNFFPHGGPGRPPGVTVRHGNWKLIRWFETAPQYPAAHELYDLSADLGELTNLAQQQPERVAALDARIDEFLKTTGALVPIPNPAYKPAGPMEAPAAPNANALLRWVPKFTDATVANGVLRLTPTGRNPFIARTALGGEGPLELRVRLQTTVKGFVRVQWRTAAQETFPEVGQTAQASLNHPGWQTVTVALPVDGTLQHLRLYLPSANQPLLIDWVELWRNSERLDRWDFGGPMP
jgi:arylsulfatase A-like enzyme